MSKTKESSNKELNKLEPDGRRSFLNIVLATFFTVFVAELGDKTQIATLLLSAQSGRPLIVFIGAATALICSSLVGVILGSWLSEKIPPERLQLIAGLVMIIIGFSLGVQALLSLRVSLISG